MYKNIQIGRPKLSTKNTNFHEFPMSYSSSTKLLFNIFLSINL